MTNYDDIWSACLLEIKETLDTDIEFHTYFQTTKLVEIKNNQATVTTNYEMNLDYLKKHLVEIKRILRKNTNQNLDVSLVTEDTYNSKKNNEEVFPPNLQEELTFDSFVVGDCNIVAQNAAINVATHPGNGFNPLFIYSNPGLGKTHLMNAIGNHALRENPNLFVKFINCKEFVDDVLNAIKTNTVDSMNKFYSNIDLLLIDDIQFLFYKEKSSEIFFFIFNNLISQGKQLVLTSDKKPDELKGFDDRLISRFNMGLSIGIDPPEYETAKVIITKQLNSLSKTPFYNSHYDENNSQVSEEVIEFMAKNFKNDIRTLQGLIRNLLFQSIILKKDFIDLDTALKIFKDEQIVKNPGSSLTPDIIIETTADLYFLTKDQLISKNRKQTFVLPREISMYLVRNLLPDITFSQIGAIYSNRDHSTIMKACKKVEEKLKSDKDYKTVVKKIKKQLGVK